MEFHSDAFIHYGLGNLFFDQMDVPTKGTRLEFADRYIVYDGRVISLQLLTLRLEDFSRPRFMTVTERAKLLLNYFILSGWDFPQAGQ
jgi:poly-gamma-glutamate synthesis protein (capsule biosynthesis protein)